MSIAKKIIHFFTRKEPRIINNNGATGVIDSHSKIDRELRRCIKEPIPEIFDVWNLMCNAVDAHLSGETARADFLFRQANSQAVWEWLNSSWTGVAKNVVIWKPAGDSHPVDQELRDPDRKISKAVRSIVLARDGYKCRYCGLPVIDARIRKQAHLLYPDAVPWDSRDNKNQHAGFQCLWLQYDHVEPHSHGGRSDPDNVVIACASCNYGKDRFTLRQLRLIDPRDTPPASSKYNGLENFASEKIKFCQPITSTPSNPRKVQTFFFPGAWIKNGYVYTLPIDGLKRWFKISDTLVASVETRDGTPGCIVQCDRIVVARRGIDPDAFLDANVH